jgi:hypothetical protein
MSYIALLNYAFHPDVLAGWMISRLFKDSVSNAETISRSYEWEGNDVNRKGIGRFMTG